jgi:hypothetical protein
MTAEGATKRSGVNQKLAGREGPGDEPNPDLMAKKENEQEKLPPAIKNGRAAVNFLRPHFDYDSKLEKRSVALEISFELREEHERFVPKEIKHWWDAMLEGGAKSITITGVPIQHIELGLAPEKDDRDLELKAAMIEKAAIAVVEEKGSGEATEVIRLTLRASVDLEAEVERFACRHFGKTIWMKMTAVQGKLL